MKKIQKVSRTHIRFGVCASVLSILCAMPSFGATNSQITRLLQQKKQKMAQLEQCAQKVKGFKIAGISTLGLTAVGVGGNIALASKNKSLERDIDSTQTQIESEKEKLEKINADIAAEELKQAKAECTARGIGWVWKDDNCNQKVVENNTTTDTAADNAQSGGGATNTQSGDAATAGETQDNQNSGQGQTAKKSSLEECLERRKNMSAEVRACCYVGTNVAKGDEVNQKCNCVNGGTFKFDEKNISKGGTCEVSGSAGGVPDANNVSTSGSGGSIGTIGNACVAVDLPTGAKSGRYAYSSDTSKKKCYQSRSDKTVSGCYCKADSCKTDEGYSLSGDKCIVEDENFAKDLKLDKCRKDLKELYNKFSNYKNQDGYYSVYLAYFCNRSGKEQEAKELWAVKMNNYPEKIRNIIEAPAASPDAKSCEVYNNFKKAYDDYNDYVNQLKKTEKKSINGTEYELYTVRSENKRMCYSDSTCVDFKKVCKIYGAEVKDEYLKNPCNIASIHKYTCDCTKASGVTEKNECEKIFGK